VISRDIHPLKYTAPVYEFPERPFVAAHSRRKLLCGETKRVRAGARQSTRRNPIVPTKDFIDWPYVALLVGIVLMVAVALYLLSSWVAYVILGALWIGLAIWSKTHR